MTWLPKNLVGPAWMVLSGIAFAALWAIIRYASFAMDPLSIVFWRNLMGTLVLLPFAIRHRALFIGRPVRIHIVRAGSGVIATYALFFAVANAPLAIVQVIGFAAPLFATLGAALLLGEQIHARRIGALAFGFAGVLVVLRPDHAALTPGVLAAIVAAIATAFSALAVKRLVTGNSTLVVVTYSFALMIPPSALIAALFGAWPPLSSLPLLAALGLTAVIAQMAMAMAYQSADATAVLPYDFVRFGIVIAIGAMMFGEAVTVSTIVGGSLILSSAIYLAVRDSLAGRLKPASEPTLDM